MQMNKDEEQHQQSSFLDLFKPSTPASRASEKVNITSRPSQIPVPHYRGLTPLPPVPEVDDLPLKQNSTHASILPSYMVLEEHHQQQPNSIEEMLETSLALNELHEEELAKALLISPEQSNLLNGLDQSFKMIEVTAIHQRSTNTVNPMVTEYVSLLVDSLVDRVVFDAELRKANDRSTIINSEEEDLLQFIKESKQHQREAMKRFEERMNRIQETNERQRWKIVELERQVAEQQNKQLELSSKFCDRDHGYRLLQNHLAAYQEKENVSMDARINLQIDMKRLKEYTSNLKQENREWKHVYQDLKEKTSTKISTLKANLRKAEDEVDDLSSAIERVIQFLQESNSEFVCREDIMLQLNTN